MSNYLAFFSPAIVNYVAYYFWPGANGDIAFCYATLMFIFIVIPLADLFFVKRYSGSKESRSGSLIETAIPLLSLPLQICNIFFFAWFIGTHDLQTYEVVVTILTAGILSALYAQNPAHELIHHGTRFERAAGIILFSTSIYSGAKLAHLYNHHVLVATSEDPTSADYGQSLYEFLPAAIAVNLFGWWGPKDGGFGNRPFRRPRIFFENLTGYALSAGWGLAIFYFFGAKSLLFFLAQSFVGILVLEMMNYIGHYGLVRKAECKRKMRSDFRASRMGLRYAVQ